MFKKAIKAAYSLDFRSLALFRVLVGTLYLFDLIFRAEDLSNHYTDLGVLPTLAWKNFVAFDWAFSFHAWSGSFYYVAAIFILHGFITVLFTLGFKTRLMTILMFIFTCSLQDRIWVVNNGGDDLLRLLLFVCIFLPLNRRASVDYALSENQPEGKSYISFWTFFFIFQLLGPYYFSAILKDSTLWNVNYQATYFALRLKAFAMPVGQWLIQYEGVLKVMTFMAIYLEWLGAILTLFNFIFFKFISHFRTIATFVFMSFHFGLIFMLDLGMFPWWMIVFWSSFLPTEFWEKLGERYSERDNLKIAIYFDKDCGFCKKVVLILRSFFLLPSTVIEPVQDYKELYEVMKSENSWVIVDNEGRIHTKFNGMIAMFKASPVLRFLTFLIDNPIIKKVGNSIYCWVSNNRKKASVLTKYLTGKEFKPLKFNIISNLFALYCIVCVLFWNIQHIPDIGLKNNIIQRSIEYLHLSQKWDLFSPFPREVNTWLEIQGVTEKGEFWDLMTNEVYTGMDTSKNFHDNIPNKQWRKYYLVIMDNQFYMKLFAEYLCRKWNIKEDRPTDAKLKRFNIFLYSERNMLNGEVSNSTRRQVWSHYCF